MILVLLGWFTVVPTSARSSGVKFDRRHLARVDEPGSVSARELNPEGLHDSTGTTLLTIWSAESQHQSDNKEDEADAADHCHDNCVAHTHHAEPILREQQPLNGRDDEQRNTRKDQPRLRNHCATPPTAQSEIRSISPSATPATGNGALPAGKAADPGPRFVYTTQACKTHNHAAARLTGVAQQIVAETSDWRDAFSDDWNGG